MTDFPQYRRSKNGKNLYRIDDDRNFVELQYIGERVLLFQVEAKTYPEMVRIQDLLACKDETCEPIGPADFEAVMQGLHR